MNLLQEPAPVPRPHWASSMPPTWNLKRVKHIAQFTTGWTPPTSDAASYDGTNQWATIGDLGPKTLYETANRISDAAVRTAGLKLSPPGSLLFSFKLSVGQVSLAGRPMFTNEAIATFHPQDGFDTGWAFYAFPQFIPENSAVNIYGARLLNQQRINDAFLPVPPRVEQERIAAYLDVETARIDTLIDEKRNLRRSLQDLERACLSDTLTGRDVATQETGNKWLPRIPDSWSLLELKYMAQVRSGLAKGKKHEGRASTVELPYMRVANVQDGHIDLSDVARIEVARDEVDRYSLREGDVLMNEGGDYDKLGRGAVWNGQIAPCLHQNHVFAVRLEDPAWAAWVALLTRTAYARFYFMNNAKQSTNLASISQTNVKRFPVVMPPEHERDALLSRLSDELSKIDALHAHVEMEINRLLELRSATVMDAVLGRIDTRSYTREYSKTETAA